MKLNLTAQLPKGKYIPHLEGTGHPTCAFRHLTLCHTEAMKQ